MEFLRGTVTPKDWMATAVILGVAALLAVLFWLVIYKGQQDRLTRLQSDIDVVSQDLAQAREIERGIEALRAETARIEELVSEFEDRLPTGPEVETLFRQFEVLASEVGVVIAVEQRPRRRDLRKETIPYEITARGSFHQIASFINRLERYKRYLKVSDLNIAREEGGVSQAKFTLSTYRFLQSAPPAVAAAQSQGQ